MQEFQLEGFKPVFSGVNFVTSCHCFVSTGFIIHQDYLDLDKRMFVVIMILMAMLILMISIQYMKVATLITMFIWFRITSQVPYQSTKFCQSCGIVKEPFSLDKDIAFQVNNVNRKGWDSFGIWTCHLRRNYLWLFENGGCGSCAKTSLKRKISDRVMMMVRMVVVLNTSLWSTQAHYHRRGDN